MTDLDGENGLGFHVRRAEQAIMARKAEALRALDLTVSQCMALGYLMDDAAKSCTQLGREANVTSQTMTGVIANLETKGFVERHTSPDHARVHLYTLTAAGEDLAARAHAVSMAIEQDLLEAFSVRDRAQFARLLDKFTELAPTAGAAPTD
jgi:DNA-binding MarR family transcriptional regulator